MLNEWIIYKENQQPGTLPKDIFLKEVVEGLAAAQIDRRRLQHRQPVERDCCRGRRCRATPASSTGETRA